MSTDVDFFGRTDEIMPMTKADRTKAQLVEKAQHLFWARGYANVPLREISSAAGVDVALVSRYFGSKRGLFEATIARLPELDTTDMSDVGALIDEVVSLFATADRTRTEPSPTTFILMNAYDADVGELVRDAFKARWQDPLEVLIGCKERAAAFSAAMLGISVAEKALHLDGIADYRTSAYREQLRRLLAAVLAS